LRAETKAEMGELRADFNELRTQTKADLRELELRIDKKLTEIKGESYLVRWMLGLIIAGIASLMVKSFFEM